MTEDSHHRSAESKGQKWTDEVQEALDRTGNAVRTAWEATRDSRMSALESAKQAVKELGEVLEKGVEAAKERWAAEQGGEATSARGESSPPESAPAESAPDTAPPEPPTSPQFPVDPTPPLPPT